MTVNWFSCIIITNNGFVRASLGLRVVSEVIVKINLKSKKLIIAIAVLVAVVAVIVILAAVFSVRQANPIVHDFSGKQIANPQDSPSADNILKLSSGKSIFFMSKDGLLSELNAQYPEWHAFAVVKNFPNCVDVHFVKRQAAVKIDLGSTVYVDSFGYVVDPPVDSTCVDITSVFDVRDTTTNEKGKPLRFVDDKSNARLSLVLEAIVASWRCNVEMGDLPVVLGEENVFTFDENDNLIVHTRAGAQIKVVEPSTNLTERLLSAYSVYYNGKLNLQQSGIVITVEKNGNIVTPNTNK